MTPYTVAIVVERDFGERLLRLAEQVHVWICDTPQNRPMTERAWAQIQPGEQWNDRGVTSFRVTDDETPEEMLLNQIAMVDLHHNGYSHDPPWSRMEIYGVAVTPEVQEALREYGVTQIQSTRDGFVCLKAET